MKKRLATLCIGGMAFGLTALVAPGAHADSCPSGPTGGTQVDGTPLYYGTSGDLGGYAGASDGSGSYVVSSVYVSSDALGNPSPNSYVWGSSGGQDVTVQSHVYPVCGSAVPQ